MDPAAVAFDAIKHAKAHDIQAVLIDTAGRMHTKDNLLSGLVTLHIFSISDKRLSLVCILPAVSISTACMSWAFACFIASNATAAGSAP